MLNAVFILNNSADVVLFKPLLHSNKVTSPDVFSKLLRSCRLRLPPCLTHEDLHYVNIERDKVFLVVATDSALTSAYLALEYLEHLSDVLKDFFGVLTEENLRSNIGLVHETFTESTMFGIPFITESVKIKPLLCNAVKKTNKSKTEWLTFVPDNIFGTVHSTREKRLAASDASDKPVLRTPDNGELFVDLIERMSVIIGHNGVLTNCSIEGQLHVKSYLHHACDLEIFFNKPNDNDFKMDKILTSASFHSNIVTTELPKSIKTKAHPGLLRAMAYHVPNVAYESSLPFTMYSAILPHVEEKMLTLSLKIHCSLPVRHPAVNVLGLIPIPSNVMNINGVSSLLNVDFKHDHNRYSFTCPIFPGDSHHSITIKMAVSSWLPCMLFELTRVILQFEIPMLCQSDMKISGLKASHGALPNTHVIKWVRYITHANSYEFRLQGDWYPT
uniref:AP-4 complex subunit mu-1 n=1 Tax=Ciona intestinalis TaxID=7719 RepID=UPI000180B2D1|nr:AP-4 complex subunit mu-1 [Ciona intestinalis]|eukprot:XP_002127993.1 AP-4 complex subunit mu-1 [Ciona intestinalis]